jgi:hypothetical protein
MLANAPEFFAKVVSTEELEGLLSAVTERSPEDLDLTQFIVHRLQQVIYDADNYYSFRNKDLRSLLLPQDQMTDTPAESLVVKRILKPEPKREDYVNLIDYIRARGEWAKG